MAYRATPEGYFFTVDRRPDIVLPLQQVQADSVPISGFVPTQITSSAIDPNLLLFGFGVLALFGLVAFLYYSGGKNKK